MPVDKFGRMSDTKTKDSGVSLTYINNNYVRSDGGTPLTGSLDMRFNKLVNLHKPTEQYDAATKDYVDYKVETLKSRTHIIAVNTRYCGVLKNGEYPFKFSNNNFGICEENIERYKDFKGLTSGFVMPQSGRIKKIICESLTYVEYDEIIDGIVEDMYKHSGIIENPDLAGRWNEWYERHTTREAFSKDIFKDKLKIRIFF